MESGIKLFGLIPIQVKLWTNGSKVKAFYCICRNNIFFGIKGKRFDGNKFADLAIKKGASISIIDKKFGKNNNRKFKVKNSLKLFTEASKLTRVSSDIIGASADFE